MWSEVTLISSFVRVDWFCSNCWAFDLRECSLFMMGGQSNQGGGAQKVFRVVEGGGGS